MIALVVVILCLAILGVGYLLGYERGDGAGWEEGFDDGFDEGWNAHRDEEYLP